MGLPRQARDSYAIPAVYRKPIFIQMCVKGNTDRVHPVGPYPHTLSVTYSESGWASASTIVEFFERIQRMPRQSRHHCQPRM